MRLTLFRATLHAMLTVTPLANYFGVAPDSIRRWSKTYRAYLSKGANPAHGFERKYSRHDAAILLYVHTQRRAGLLHREIAQRLVTMQGNEWDGLPSVPNEWFSDESAGLITISAASEGAATLAELAAVQVEAESMRVALQDAEERANKLQLSLEHEQSLRTASEARIHVLELDAERAQADVRELRAHMAAYTLAYGFGRDRPVHVSVIIAVSVLLAVLVVLVVFVAAKLLL